MWYIPSTAILNIFKQHQKEQEVNEQYPDREVLRQQAELQAKAAAALQALQASYQKSMVRDLKRDNDSIEGLREQIEWYKEDHKNAFELCKKWAQKASEFKRERDEHIEQIKDMTEEARRGAVERDRLRDLVDQLKVHPLNAIHDCLTGAGERGQTEVHGVEVEPVTSPSELNLVARVMEAIGILDAATTELHNSRAPQDLIGILALNIGKALKTLEG